jgi:hypothetical protein
LQNRRYPPAPEAASGAAVIDTKPGIPNQTKNKETE